VFIQDVGVNSIPKMELNVTSGIGNNYLKKMELELIKLEFPQKIKSTN